MAKLNRRRRWRGPALGGPLQRGARYCFAAFDGEITTAQLTERCRPKIVHAGDQRWLFGSLRDKVTSSARLIAPCWSPQAEDRVT
jgi:hypothetical protein